MFDMRHDSKMSKENIIQARTHYSRNIAQARGVIDVFLLLRMCTSPRRAHASSRLAAFELVPNRQAGEPRPGNLECSTQFCATTMASFSVSPMVCYVGPGVMTQNEMSGVGVINRTSGKLDLQPWLHVHRPRWSHLQPLFFPTDIQV